MQDTAGVGESHGWFVEPGCHKKLGRRTLQNGKECPHAL
jgi:hypothetical protein